MILITIIQKKKNSPGTHSFVNKLSEFAKFCKLIFVFYAHEITEFNNVCSFSVMGVNIFFRVHVYTLIMVITTLWILRD